VTPSENGAPLAKGSDTNLAVSGLRA
jgi:hypothetical protein